MCGIVSIISKRQGGFWHADLELFEGLLILDTTRGLDSTGVFCVDSARQVGFMKVASHPFNLFAIQGYQTWRSQAVQRGRILVGHNRKATQGSINSRNAHPFHSGNIVLVHNGTLRGDHKKDYAPVDVDSHALAIAFDEQGAENVIPKINGAFALIWWDIEKNSLFAVRNDERPLEIVETDDHYIVLSEAWMAERLLEKDRKKIINVHKVEAGKLHEFKIGGALTIKDIKIKEYEYPAAYTGSTNVTGRGRVVQHGGAQASSVQSGKSQSSSGNQTVAGSNGGSGTTDQKTTSPSPARTALSTALTVVRNGPSANGETATVTKVPQDAAAHVPCEEFTVGMTILVKLYEMKLNDSKELYFCRGKVVEPNTPEIDVSCYIKASDMKEGTEHLYTSRAVEAVILKHTDSICGRSLYVNKVSLPTFVNVHNNNIAENEWSYVTTYCKCQSCQAPIYDEEREFTAVNRRPHNQYSVTCADCIQETLKGQDQYEFHQNRLVAVQAYVGQRPAPASSNDGGTASSGSQTLH